MSAPELTPRERLIVERFENAPAAPESWTAQRLTPQRALGRHIDPLGNVQVRVEVGAGEPWMAACNRNPAGAARFLRELADDVEAAS